MPNLADLQHDLDTIDLRDGRRLRLAYRPDDNTTLADEEWHGALELIGRHADRRPRPDGFDGRARKLRTRFATYWWQPPADVPDDALDALCRSITDILEYGYNGVVLEVLEGADAYGQPIVTDYATVWGVEPFVAPDDLQQLLADLATELPDDIRQQLHGGI